MDLVELLEQIISETLHITVEVKAQEYRCEHEDVLMSLSMYPLLYEALETHNHEYSRDMGNMPFSIPTTMEMQMEIMVPQEMKMEMET